MNRRRELGLWVISLAFVVAVVGPLLVVGLGWVRL